MSEPQRCLFTPSFNRAIKIRQRDSRLTSHAGAIILREADHRLGLIESVVELGPYQAESWRHAQRQVGLTVLVHNHFVVHRAKPPPKNNAETMLSTEEITT